MEIIDTLSGIVTDPNNQKIAAATAMHLAAVLVHKQGNKVSSEVLAEAIDLASKQAESPEKVLKAAGKIINSRRPRMIMSAASAGAHAAFAAVGIYSNVAGMSDGVEAASNLALAVGGLHLVTAVVDTAVQEIRRCKIKPTMKKASEAVEDDLNPVFVDADDSTPKA